MWVCVVIYSHVYVYMDVRLRTHHPLYVTTACEDLLICTRKGGNPVSLKHIIFKKIMYVNVFPGIHQIQSEMTIGIVL